MFPQGPCIYAYQEWAISEKIWDFFRPQRKTSENLGQTVAHIE